MWLKSKIVLKKRGIFKKHIRYEIPLEFTKECIINTNDTAILYEDSNDNFIVLCNSPEVHNKKRVAIDNLLNERNVQDEDDIFKSFKKLDKVRHRDVNGLFEFNGKLYFRYKNGASKSLDDPTKSFLDSVRESIEDLKDINTSELSDVLVTPLKIKN